MARNKKSELVMARHKKGAYFRRLLKYIHSAVGTELFTAKSFLDENIIAQKIECGKFDVDIAMMPDGNDMIAILIDGNHRLQAAIRIQKLPEINIARANHGETLKSYLKKLNDLSNPINAITGKPLYGRQGLYNYRRNSKS